MLATARPSCLILSHSLDGDVHVATSNAFERGSMVGYARVKMLAAGGGGHIALPCNTLFTGWNLLDFLLIIHQHYQCTEERHLSLSKLHNPSKGHATGKFY